MMPLHVWIKEKYLLTLFICLFIIVRSIYFPLFAAFSSDQANFSLHALDIMASHKFTLVGPAISFALDGRTIFQGSIVYYFTLLFLLLGHLDPMVSSYLFMIFCGFMVIPLYYGAKMLINSRAAWLITTIYVFFPFYIAHTRYLWNANYQFALLPIVIFLMGLYKVKSNVIILVLLGGLLGLLLQFHYQLVTVLIGLVIYYIKFASLGLKRLGLFFGGFLLGLSPMLAFEVHSHFYNSQTIVFFLTHAKSFVGQKSNSYFGTHYLLSVSLFAFLLIIYFLRQHVTYRRIALVGGVLGLWSLALVVQKPNHAEGMIAGWNYPSEAKVHQIIVAQHLKDFNVVNLPSDTLAQVQKYLLRKDKVKINENNYKTEHYLFVISKDANYMQNPAYEVNSFTPSSLVNQWPINNAFTLYLLERKPQD